MPLLFIFKYCIPASNNALIATPIIIIFVPLKATLLVNKYNITPTNNPPNIAAKGNDIYLPIGIVNTMQAKNPAPFPIPSISVDAKGFLSTP